MQDGLYRVTYKGICAGFVVEGGSIVQCAPILRRKLTYRMTVAVLIKPFNEEEAMETIDRFDGDYRFLSNFWYGDGNLVTRLWGYSTIEHYFQAMKTTDKAIREHIRAAGTPGQAKGMGRKLRLRPDWEKIKDEVMLTGLRAKFAPGTDLAQRLITTGDAILIEGNHWHDNYWGNCNCKNYNGQFPQCLNAGKNMLGKLLMQVRDELNNNKENK